MNETQQLPAYLQASDWTGRKELAFRKYIQTYTAIAAAIQRKYPHDGPWLYFELTAGSGYIENGSGFIEGSPLIALQAFRKESGFHVNCIFVEHNPAYAEQLRNALSKERITWTASERDRVRYMIVCDDHQKLLNDPSVIRRAINRMGLIYWDGLGGDYYPAQALQRWLVKNQCHDVLIMASSTAQKRMGRTRLDRLLLTVPRTVWISDVNGAWEWIFALGTAWQPLADRLSKAGIELFVAHSAKGKEIRDKLGLTKEQRKDCPNQMPLFSEYQTYEEYLKHPKFLEIRQEAFKRAGGQCEVCGALATQSHHLRYPAWGEFDIVENLLMVCHRCHCRIERKEK